MKEQLMAEDRVRRIAAYSMRIIVNYLNEVRAGASPYPPEECPNYEYFNEHYKNLVRMAEGETPREILESMKKEKIAP